ncbi:MAG: AAA family ATPase [Clostridiales bacterium]|nr:AAA family ATPase [Clostridiales bacterium]
MKNENAIILAFTGKGGVGKTSLSALSVRLLAEKHPDKRILAIDADPAIGLATALDFDVASTVDDIRKQFVSTAQEGNTNAAVELLGEAKYRMTDALAERNNISFLAIGRPETAGCYCKVNAYLKEIISMIAGNFDYVIIDGEAGIEQVNRRVMEKVTHLIFVSDASKKGLQVVKTIHKVAKELVIFDKAGLIINRVPDIELKPETDDIEILSLIPDDRNMSLNDIMGKSVFEIDEDSAIVKGTKTALERMGIY